MLDPAIYWLIIGVILLFLELVLPGFILFFFGLGALVTSFVAWLTPANVAWQLGIFIAASLVALISLRNVIQEKLFSKSGADNDEEDKDIVEAIKGERGVVSSSIDPPGEGRIKYGGSFWRATADEMIEEGEIISVVRQDNLIIHVEKVSST